MAALDTNVEHTLAEVAKRHDPDGKLAKIVDVLSKQNPILEEGYWTEANDFTSHEYTQVNSEPSGSWTGPNEFVDYETGTTRQVKENISLLEGYNRIDTRILGKAKDEKKYRYDNDMIQFRGLTKTAHTKIFYGNNTSDIKEPHGFATRYNNNTTWGNTNIYSAGADNANSVTSAYLIKWGLDGVYFAYPRDGKEMLDMQDLGEQLMQQNGNSAYLAKVTRFLLQFAVCVADDRCIQRICNIGTDGNNNVTGDDIITVINRFPSLENVVMYVNRTVKTQLDIAAQNKTNVNLTIGEAWGRPTTFFQGIPVRLCEAIVDTEGVVS
jgi:hypothetical protein